MTHVPYKGSVPAMTDLVAGRVHFGIPTLPAALPEVPSLLEAGVADYETALWTSPSPASSPPSSPPSSRTGQEW